MSRIDDKGQIIRDSDYSEHSDSKYSSNSGFDYNSDSDSNPASLWGCIVIFLIIGLLKEC